MEEQDGDYINMKIKFDFRFKYILHLVLIVATLFVSYYLGDYLLDFSKNSIIKMFLWFLAILFLADNFWESVLKV
jgi:hypothetical protein